MATEHRRPVKRAPRVLMYHFFGEAPAEGDPAGLFVSGAALAEQLAWLDRHNWKALTLDQYLAALDGVPAPRKSYLLTIDDGHESVLEIAAPILAAAGVPAVLYVCPGLIGGHVCWSKPYASERLLDAEQLRTAVQTGMEIGVHGHDHTRLHGMTSTSLKAHTSEAAELLTAHTGVVPRTFAYPFGTWDAHSRQSVADAGYLAGFAVARFGGRFAIDRIGIFGSDSLLTFRLKLSSPYRLLSRTAGRFWRLRHALRRRRER